MVIDVIPWNKGKKNVYSKESLERFSQSKLRKPTKYWLGKKRSQATINKIMKAKIGKPSKRKGKPSPKTANENHPFWKGSKVSYDGLHKWVNRKLGKPTTCEHCGKTGLKGKFIHWANKSHKYKRNLTDWIRLCAECHKKYDL